MNVRWREKKERKVEGKIKVKEKKKEVSKPSSRGVETGTKNGRVGSLRYQHYEMLKTPTTNSGADLQFKLRMNNNLVIIFILRVTYMAHYF